MEPVSYIEPSSKTGRVVVLQHISDILQYENFLNSTVSDEALAMLHQSQAATTSYISSRILRDAGLSSHGDCPDDPALFEIRLTSKAVAAIVSKSQIQNSLMAYAKRTTYLLLASHKITFRFRLS